MTTEWVEVHVGDQVRILAGPDHGKVGIVREIDNSNSLGGPARFVPGVIARTWFFFYRWEFTPLADTYLTADERDQLAELEKTEERTGA